MGGGWRGGILPRRRKKPPIWRFGWRCAPVEKFTSRIEPGLHAAHIKFTDTHRKWSFFIYARAGEEITLLRSMYADRKPSHREPSHAKEKNFANRLTRICVYVTEPKKSQPERPLDVIIIPTDGHTTVRLFSSGRNNICISFSSN